MKQISSNEIICLLKEIKQKRPLVHCITNIVTVNDCANILLAAGASPTMAHHPEEVAEMAANACALVLNMGATESFDAMRIAGAAAGTAGIPIILDPVGAAGTSFRRNQTLAFIQELHPTCIRGNFSEIRALATNQTIHMGVDALSDTSCTQKEAITLVTEFARQTGAIVIASGETDFISDGSISHALTNGSSMMSKITGSGCMSSALLGAFLGTESSIASAAASCLVMGICGEIAEAKTLQEHGGTMSFRNHLIDAMFLLEQEQIQRLLQPTFPI